ncbi:MAG: hypothetical protein Q4G07_12150 [Oscillospiraceae bacterium]|nr:hypothetical protein [Oscillospiraceae bacterium]
MPWLNGIPFSHLPVYAKILVCGMAALLCLSLICAVIFIIKNKERRGDVLRNTILFFCFIGAMMVINSISIRLEMRWMYIPYAAILLYLAYLCGEFWRAGKNSGKHKRLLCGGAACILLLYTLVAYPAEMCYRSYWNNLYYWHEQQVNNWIYENIQVPMEDEFWEKDIVFVVDPWQAASQNYIRRTTLKAFQAHRPAEIEEASVPEQIIVLSTFDIAPAEWDEDIVVLYVETAASGELTIQEVTERVKKEVKEAGGLKRGIDENNWVMPNAALWATAGSTGKIRIDGYWPFNGKNVEIKFFIDDEEKAFFYPKREGGFSVEIDSGVPNETVILSIVCVDNGEEFENDCRFLLQGVSAVEENRQIA